MSALQSNFAAIFHRRVEWWLVRESCETSPLGAVASRVPLQSPLETNWSVASFQRLKATLSLWKVQRFAGFAPWNLVLPSLRYVPAYSGR